MQFYQLIRLFNLNVHRTSNTYWQRHGALLIILAAYGCGSTPKPSAIALAQSDAVDAKTYYDAVTGFSGSSLKQSLHQIIRHSRRLNYNQIWAQLKYTDQDPTRPDNVIMVYTGRSLSNTAVGDEEEGLIEWNREHVWAKARGFPRADMPAYSDLHHLRPCEASINRARGSMMFGEAEQGQELPEAPGGYVDTDNALFEPPAPVKGDIARMLFYMDVRYQGDTSKEPDLRLVEKAPGYSVHGIDIKDNGYFANLSTLIRWHLQDPVDDHEKTRNERVYEVQGNRNPFIDHPEFADSIYLGAR
jgi:endonuclease I